MIDITREQVFSLTEAARLLPRRRRGRKPSPSTLYRWAKYGLRGTRLETIRIGGTRCTSVEALQRFAQALSADEQSGPVPPLPAADDVDAELNELGL